MARPAYLLFCLYKCWVMRVGCMADCLTVWVRVNLGVCVRRGGGVTELCRALGGQIAHGDSIPRRWILYDVFND